MTLDLDPKTYLGQIARAVRACGVESGGLRVSAPLFGVIDPISYQPYEISGCCYGSMSWVLLTVQTGGIALGRLLE